MELVGQQWHFKHRRQSHAGGGTTTASLVSGGEPGTRTAPEVEEEYNGSSWTDGY